MQKRTRQMRYYEYRGQHFPIGSGVTEAACKTVVTQRLKLSGMRWEKANAQKILDLRVLRLSGIWAETYRNLSAALDLLVSPSAESQISKQLHQEVGDSCGRLPLRAGRLQSQPYPST